jgi:hypothetical protein
MSPTNFMNQVRNQGIGVLINTLMVSAEKKVSMICAVGLL